MSSALQIEGAARLGVDHDAAGLFQIGVAVHVGVANPESGFQNRHDRGAGDEFDQAGPSAWDDHVEMRPHPEHVPDDRPVGVLDQTHPPVGQPAAPAGVTERCNQGGIACDGLGTTAQHGGVAGFEADRGDVYGNVGSALKN